MNMKIEDQIKALAELDGWDNLIFDDYEFLNKWWNGNPIGRPPINQKPHLPIETSLWKIPNYLNCRDVIISLIEKQSDGIKINIVNYLQRMRCIVTDTWTSNDVVEILLATAQQLCEALLRATGKWKEV